ncbi:bifunctional diguanylate cyclase/phosphodiesterase [Roseateles aquatilis]|uniref:Bifunctional diguanylate cyclase/phosphodiesterase n=1 Tax=Roseateles aquatilis TaxID=431061 RepID=A0A246J2V3_9BURK|nr:bifunctional diguanylate cyclase/phosphodiesterase [Roseateles aquatilis]OWQ86915.1 bifunctional diguanylate cyclase/phosphodiesterase [Roseateles aquatilis]
MTTGDLTAATRFLEPTYDPWVVAASFLIAVFVSYVAIELAKRERERGATEGLGWWVGGSFAMGTGVWSMHFVGMLAYSLPIQLGYDKALTLSSWLAAVGVSGVALWIARKARLTACRVIVGSIGMASGICAMHYTGMAALALSPAIVWSRWLIAASALVALGASMAALLIFDWLLRLDRRKVLYQANAALLMGVAITGMHYTGMAAANVPVGAFCVTAGAIAPKGLLLLVVGFTCSVLVLTLLLSLHSKSRQLARSLISVNERLQTQAFHDSLTQLPNRTLFKERLSRAYQRYEKQQARGVSKKFAVLFVDLDNFKPVNDSFGHESGDAILIESARRLTQVARQSDVVARVGGDEFVLLIEDLGNIPDAQALAARLTKSLLEPFEISPGHELRLSASIGIAAYPEHGPLDKLIVNADAAMYSAKRGGGGAYAVFQQYMECDAADQVTLQSDLRLAVERGQLRLHYQPKVEARNGGFIGVEALLRWEHPERGMVPPNLFIPVAERFGLIAGIGDWVIEEACRQMRAWADDGHVVHVAVNVSALQLRQANFVAKTKSALQRHAILPSQLLCEITESAAMEDVQATQSTLEELGKVGLFLSIDDFGTGYSSLGFLRQLPARQLKIDRSFVQDVDSNNDARSLVDAVVRLAHALGLCVVAEGVETVGQQRALVDLGCDELQGYFFSRPMSADRLISWIDDRGAAMTSCADDSSAA